MTIRTIIVPVNIMVSGIEVDAKAFQKLADDAAGIFGRTYPQAEWELIYKGTIEYEIGQHGELVVTVYQFFRNDGKNIIETFPEGFKTS